MHISTTELQHLLQTWGYIAVFLFVAIEYTGIPFPGETMLITAAAYAGTGHLQIQWVILAAILGSSFGSTMGYGLGLWGGRRLVDGFGHYIGLTEPRLRVAERFFLRHGDKTVFLGRFVAVLRAWAAFLAGLNRMPFLRFTVFNIAGSIVWSILFGTLGFVLGKNLPLLERVVTDLGIAGIVLIVAAAVALYIVHKRTGGIVERLLEEDDQAPRQVASK